MSQVEGSGWPKEVNLVRGDNGFENKFSIFEDKRSYCKSDGDIGKYDWDTGLCIWSDGY